MRFRRAGMVLFVVAVAGCGGGGGGGGSSMPPPVTATPTPAATPTPTPVPTSTTPLPAPVVGYLAGSGSSFSGTTVASARAVTLSPISEILIPRPAAPAFLSTAIRVDVGSPTQAVARRASSTFNAAPVSAPRVSLSAEKLVNPGALSSLLSRLQRAPSAVATAIPAAAPTTTRTFAVLSSGIGPSSTSYVSVGTTLQQTTAHGYVYVDNSLGLSPSVTAAIGADFENAYLSDTTHFGTPDYPSNAPNGPLNGTAHPCDASGNVIPGSSAGPVVIPDSDQHTYVVIVSQANASNGEGGYFDPANYFVQSFANCSLKTSNGVPMIVLVWPRNADPNYETQEDMVRVSAHEFQHLINFVNHCILSPTCNQTGSDDPWLNEGLSMLAQDLAVRRLYPNVSYDVDDALYYAGQFLQSPQSFNLGSFAGIDAGTSTPAFNCNGCYGAAYLLERYLYNRFGGDAYTQAMTSASWKLTSGGTSKTNLIAVTGEDFGPMLGDFSIALMGAQNGLNATAPFTFALNPSGTYTDQFGNPTTLPGLAVAGTNAIGSSTIYNSCQGCFFYVGIPTNGAAATLKVTDVNASASLAAGITQR